MSIFDLLINNYPGEDLLFAVGYNDAILGIDEHTMRICYSVKKLLEVLENDGMNEEEALEFFSINIEGAYVGEKTPIWVRDNYCYE